MNIHIQEDDSPSESEDHIHIWFSNIRIFGSYFRKLLQNKYLRLKNQFQKYDPILDLKDRNVRVEFQKNPERKKITSNSEKLDSEDEKKEVNCTRRIFIFTFIKETT